jgi:hypothetical protein
MPHSAHIGVYLVHAIFCRWWAMETYFPTIPHKYLLKKKPNPFKMELKAEPFKGKTEILVGDKSEVSFNILFLQMNLESGSHFYK